MFEVSEAAFNVSTDRELIIKMKKEGGNVKMKIDTAGLGNF